MIYTDNIICINTNNMYYLSIGCVFKNEGHALFEFIEHHMYHGVDHIYMINDNSTDNYLDIIQPYIEKGYITLFHNNIEINVENRQTTIYEKYFKNILNDTQWIAIIDLDEFLYSPNDLDIKSIIEKYENDYEKIIVEWKMFGSNNCIHQPFSIVSGFNKHSELDKNNKYYSYKSILKTNAITNLGIHTSETTTNKSINLSFTTNINELFINHYQNQSVDFYTKIKGTRGDADNHFEKQGLTRNLEHFKNMDSNEITDNTLIDQNQDIIKKVKNYKLSHMNDRDVTMVITSCNRPGLLEETFDSFIKHNTYPIKEYIIIDDSGKIGINDFLKEKYKNENITLLYNKINIGQVKSIDIAYEYVTTNYIFHCEEDWLFIKPGFIEASFAILDDDPNIFTVWLRPHNDTSGHPIDFSYKKNNYYKMKTDFTYIYNSIEYVWCGFTFNPGLRRTKDVLFYHPYSKNIRIDPELNEVCEYVINEKYKNAGYYGAITDVTLGYVTHLGKDAHVKRSYE